MISETGSVSEISAMGFMAKLFSRLFIASALFIVTMGAISTIMQITKAINISNRRIQQVIELHENELLNELALRDYPAISQHLEMLKKQLSADSICLILKTQTISFPSDSGDCKNRSRRFWGLFGDAFLSEVSLANEFGDYQFLLRVDSSSSLIESIITPMLISAFLVFLIAMVPLAGGYYLIFALAKKNMLVPLTELTSHLNHPEKDPGIEGAIVSAERDYVVSELEALSRAAQRFSRLAAGEAIAKMASQVSHDIRSPLSALNLVVGQLNQIPETHRLLIRNSVERINDIANTLLKRSKDEQVPREGVANAVIDLLPVLVGSVVSEKRVQLRSRPEIQLECDLRNAYGAFFNGNPSDIKRVLSNLISNAIESLPESGGRVSVAVRKFESMVRLLVIDNGKGIPAYVLPNLGNRGVSYGKQGETGFGLGLSHAKEIVEKHGGTLTVQSKEGSGTIVAIELPTVDSPKWFAEKISLSQSSQVVSVDDDASIHSVWASRIGQLEYQSNPTQHLTFASPNDLKNWIHAKSEAKTPTTFLVDYEFLDEATNGLDLIEELEIGSNSILVTSRYEDLTIRSRCERLGVRLIPKTMADLVPIDFSTPN